jgi:pyrimidine deaminase RibD-like protein
MNHAEAMALAQISGDLAPIVAYVTLEPCSFQGRTPSCAKALVASGIKRVVVAMLDPDPRNAGAGIQILRSWGIEVFVGLLAPEAYLDLAPYLSKHQA